MMNRRMFLERVLGGTALSIAALADLNASTYEDLAALDAAASGQPSPDGAYWEAIKQHFVFEDGLIMMNNGTVGPIPKPVFETTVHYLRMQMTAPCDCYLYLPSRLDEVRAKVARFVGASPEEIAILRNTTEGMNFFIGGFDMKAGDEIVTSNLEHPGGINPLRLKAKRHGVVVKEVTVGVPPASAGEIVDAFAKAITPRTRMLLISHTVFKTGLIAPIKELGDLAHQHGMLLLADSAHGAGMIDMNLSATGVDCWGSSPYKWLGAPAGTGIFYIRRDVQDRIWPTIASGGWDTQESARKFETLSQRNDALIMALGEAIEFQNHIGRSRIERRIQTLAAHLKEGLAAIPKVRLHTNTGTTLSSGLTAFSIPGVDPNEIVNHVREKYNIVVRTIGDKASNSVGVRVSTHIWLSLKDVDLLVQGVDELARRTSFVTSR
jgi:selenocysteine lyase/cysteine desulfurase